jgi:hypothetical protein
MLGGSRLQACAPTSVEVTADGPLTLTELQVAGGITGTWIAHGMLVLPLWQVSAKVWTDGSTPLSEVVATAVLILTILGSMCRPETVRRRLRW